MGQAKRSTASDIGIVALLLITLLAYLLQAATTPLLRLYEGYWPEWFPIDRALGDQEQTFKTLTTAYERPQGKRAAARAFNRLYYSFPRIPDRLRPTSLGNTLTAAAAYVYDRYNIETALWWPRLLELLPKDFRKQVETSLTQVMIMLNLTTILILVSLGASGGLLIAGRHWWPYAATMVIGLMLAWGFYRAAVLQAVNYGTFLRVAFDLHRSKILKQMRIPLPPNLGAERNLWTPSTGGF